MDRGGKIVGGVITTAATVSESMMGIRTQS
jgi:hypothetical protein